MPFYKQQSAFAFKAKALQDDVSETRASIVPTGNPVHDLQARLRQLQDKRVCLLIQAEKARELGSLFVANVLEAGFRQIDHGPRTSALMGNWPGDPAAAALALRFNAAIHALARKGSPELLASLFAGEHLEFDDAIAEALRLHDCEIAQALRHPTQTNEVARAGAITAALSHVSASIGMPFELLELGSSSGLNLNLSQYSYDLGGVKHGVDRSPVHVQPEWRGSAAPQKRFEVVSARGVDMHPLDATNAATAERLMSFVFADQPKRLARLEKAIGLASLYPPSVEESSALPWIVEQLALEQPHGVCRVVFHSMVLQYFAHEERQQTLDAIGRAGARASYAKPFAHISFEWVPDRTEVQLRARIWPKGHSELLAVCHPYGDWIDWKLA